MVEVVAAFLGLGRRQRRRGNLRSFAPAQDRDNERHTLFQSGQCRAAPLPPAHHCRPHDRRAWQVARRNRWAQRREL